MKQLGKKALLLLLCLTMLMSMLTTVTVGAADNEVFTSQIGKGTAESPYELTTAADISKVAELTTSNADYAKAHYKLMNDIDMSSVTDFQGLSKWNNQIFSGTFDGNMHVIKNMTITTTDTRPRGFIGVSRGATIKNLGIENANVTGFPCGGIIGFDHGDTTVKNCFVKNAKLTGTHASGPTYVGGIVGGVASADSGMTTIVDSYTTGLTMNENGSGIKGCLTWTTTSNANITNCYTTHGNLTTGTGGEIKNSFSSATASSVKAANLGASFIVGSKAYSNGLPVLAWEADRFEPETPGGAGEEEEPEDDGMMEVTNTYLKNEFETSAQTGEWTGATTSSVASAGVEGTAAMKVDGMQKGTRLHSPSMDWKKGGSYSIKVWMKASQTTTVQACVNTGDWMRLTTDSTNNGLPWNYRYPNKSFTVNTEWREYTFDWSIIDFITSQTDETPTGATKTTAPVFLCTTAEIPEGFVLYVDKFSVTEKISVPKPSEDDPVRIVVYEEDFEDGIGNFSPASEPMVLTHGKDADNGYGKLAVDSTKAEAIATKAHNAGALTNLPAGTPGGWKGGRWSTEFYHGALQVNEKFEFLNDKNYHFEWLMGQRNVQADGSVTNAQPAGGNLNAVVLQATDKTVFTNATAAAAKEVYPGLKTGSAAEKDGFYQYSNDISAYKFGTKNEDGTFSGSAIMNYWHIRTRFGAVLAQEMAAKKLYCGKGTGAYNASGTLMNRPTDYYWGPQYKFTLDRSDFYGDETLGKGGAPLFTSDMTQEQKNAVMDSYIYADGTGADSTKKEWSLAYDCSFLYSPTRIQKMQELLETFPYYYVVDDFRITAEAKEYSVAVNAGQGGKVVALTNPATDTETTVTGEGTVKANDYFGATYTFVPDEGYGISSVLYNGEEKIEDLSGDSLVIAPEEVGKKHTLVVTFEEGKVNLPAPDPSLTENVIDSYLPKEGLTKQAAKYTFDTEADVNKWTLTIDGGKDADKKVTDATKSWDAAGANGTTGALKHTAGGIDYRPRLIGPDQITWSAGSKYVIKAWMKSDSTQSVAPWINHAATIKTDKSSGAYLNYGNVNARSEWSEFTWEFEIQSITQSNNSLSSVSTQYMTRIGGDNPVGTIWIDELVVTEIIPGYEKLGLMAENDLLFPNETMELTVVGNNGRANYKVANEGMTFVSSDEAVATVDANGVVTAKANGRVRIGVTDGELTGSIDLTVSDENNAKAELHIAKNGNDETGDGSNEAPFASIEKAKAAIKEYRRMPEGGVTVYIHEGEYVLSNTLTFTSADSGTQKSPITYKAYQDDVVDFVGSKKLDATKIQKVTDKALLDRLVEDHAKDDLYMLDLKAQGVTMSPVVAYGSAKSAPTPNRIFMNGSALIEARWPNDDKTGEQYFTRAQPAPDGTFDATKYNANNQPAAMQYLDEDNRSAKWTIKEGDALVGGSIAYLWAAVDLRIDELDAENKIVKTLDASSYGQSTYTAKTERYLYFKNIFEEIDMPGESYVDRETGILYFYPVGKVDGAEMEVSVLNSNMVEFKGASYITLDGINLKNSRRSAVIMDENSESITIKNAEITGMSVDGVQVKGKNQKVDGCHIYEIGGTAITVAGGDRPTLTSSGTEITNNVIHNVNYYIPSGTTAVSVSGVGHRIAHNEIYDINIQSIRFTHTNNVVIEYNEFYDSELLNADGGVLYWGRNFSEMGNIVRYNYFHDIGGHIGAHGQQSIFTDDGETGPAIYGNIMYKGGLPSFPLKTNGGQFHWIYHNIVLDNGVGAYMQNWSVGPTGVKDTMKPTSWWTYVMDMRDLFGGGNTNLLNDGKRKELTFSETWMNYYKNVEPTKQWAKLYDYLNPEMYEAAKKIYDTKDKAAMTKWLNDNIPAGHTNLIEKNVWVNVPTIAQGWFEAKNNLQLKGAEGETLFENYGTDFSLTKDGLAKVRQTIPDFPDLDFDAMGTEFDVQGNAPTASDAYVTGVPAVKGNLVANYTYSDADGDQEGISKIYWYASDSEDGEYTRITEGYGKNYKVSSEYEGKYIRFEVVAYDVKSVYGDATVSEPIYIAVNTSGVDKTALWEAITEVADALGNAVVGEEVGQYPQEAVDKLTAALDEARAVANDNSAYTFLVEQATAALENAYDVFKNSVNNPMTNVDADRISLNKMLKDQDNWKVALTEDMEFTEDGSLVFGGESNTLVSYMGRKFGNTEFSFKMKAEIPDPENANAVNSWVGIYLRQDDTDGMVWTGGRTGFMIDLKQNLIQLQKYPTAALLTDSILNNKKIVMGQEYVMTVGLYDVAEPDEMLFVLTLDGETIYSQTVAFEDLYGSEGYFAMNAGNNTKVTISPIYADTEKLDETVSNAENFLETVVVGDGYGEYSEDAVNALKDAIADAKKVEEDKDALQADVDAAALAVRQALIDARNATSAKGEIKEDASVTINYNHPTADLTVKTGVDDLTIDVDPTREQPAINVTSDDMEMGIEAGTVISGDFKVPVLGSTPSGNFTSGEVSKVYGQGAEAVDADTPVRIVLKGEAGKNVAYKNENGKYSLVLKSLKEDSLEAATAALEGQNYKAIKMNVGSDLVLYTYQLTEFVTYTDKTGTITPTPTPPTKTPSTGTGGGISAGGVGSAVVVGDKKVPFVDIVGHWAESDIGEMYKKEIVSGVDDTHFEPDRSITRAEFAALMTRALKLSVANSQSVFNDVADSAWYADEVAAAAAAGLIVGYDGNFRPNDTITREEMAVVVMKAYVFLGKTVKSGKIDQFADKADIAAWAVSYVDQAVSTGIITGMSEDTFAPKENATRAQVTSLIKRLLNNK